MSPTDPGAGPLTIVVPSHNRADALRTNLPALLALDDVEEIIVVVEEGADDESHRVVAGFADDRMRLLLIGERAGLSAAKNAGAQQASCEWILFGEDDCVFPPDYGTTLRATALKRGAHIAGAPWLHVQPGTDVAALLRERRSKLPSEPRIDRHGGVPASPVETPFMPATALVHRDVFAAVTFDTGYRVNFYRQETAFFIEALRRGFHAVLTPETACYQIEQWNEGGTRVPRLRYEYWTLRNNWRFLGLHGDWLTEQGHIKGRLRFQLGFTRERLWTTGSGFVGSRLRKWRR